MTDSDKQQTKLTQETIDAFERWREAVRSTWGGLRAALVTLTEAIHQAHDEGNHLYRADDVCALCGQRREDDPSWPIATCMHCQPALTMPFRDERERDAWADEHEQGTGHTVTDSSHG